MGLIEKWSERCGEIRRRNKTVIKKEEICSEHLPEKTSSDRRASNDPVLCLSASTPNSPAPLEEKPAARMGQRSIVLACLNGLPLFLSGPGWLLLKKYEKR